MGAASLAANHKEKGKEQVSGGFVRFAVRLRITPAQSSFASKPAMRAFEDRPKRDKQLLIRRTADLMILLGNWG